MDGLLRHIPLLNQGILPFGFSCKIKSYWPDSPPALLLTLDSHLVLGRRQKTEDKNLILFGPTFCDKKRYFPETQGIAFLGKWTHYSYIDVIEKPENEISYTFYMLVLDVVKTLEVYRAQLKSSVFS